MSSLISRKTITDLLCSRLAEIPNTTVYLRRVGFKPGTNTHTPPPTVSSTDLRVRPYLVVYPSPGMDGPDRRLDSRTNGRIYRPQITCVVGDETAIDLLVDAVSTKLDGWRPTLPGPLPSNAVGHFRPLAGFDPGPTGRDDDITPARFYTALQYVLPVYA